MQVGRLFARDDLRAGRGERDLVGRPVLHGGNPDDDHKHRNELEMRDVEKDEREADVEQPEQAAREEHPDREPRIAPERLPLHDSDGSDGR